jgi:hypothetical protein
MGFIRSFEELGRWGFGEEKIFPLTPYLLNSLSEVTKEA